MERLPLSSGWRSHKGEVFLVAKEKDNNNVVDLREAWQRAEQRAYDREIKKRKLIEDMKEVTGEDYYIGKKKNPFDRVRFAQFIQENWLYLREKKYLINEEKNFLVDIQCNISFRSNAIVDNIKSKVPNALNINSIAEMLGTSRTRVSRIVNSLIKKGIFSKAISGDIKQPHQAKDYVLFVNPHIIYSGSRQQIEEHLTLQFKNQMKKNTTLKKLPVKLF